jgi:sulfite reductase (NADPH) hemoprotein beta-component
MYAYDELDRTLISERVNEFRDQVRRRLAGELSEEKFRPLRLMNGLYLQLHAYMLRVAIPYGTVSSRQMRMLARIARRYDRGYGHFTTRQNIQFNWLALDDVPDLLADLASVDMHAIQTSGNCIRNVTADHLAGIAPDEVADPRVYGEVIRQWSTLHPEFSFLPRKFKVAVTGASADRAAIHVHDIGLRVVTDAAGALGFEVWVGGGLGRTPMLAKLIRAFLPERHLVSYLEAILRAYNQYGRRDNMYKARIKILVHEIGIETFREEVEAEWSRIRYRGYDVPPEEVARIRQLFAPPPYEPATGNGDSLDRALLREPEFAAWVGRNVSQHRQPGYSIVNVSLKPVGGIPGDATADQMDTIADLAERFGFGQMRVSHEQNLVLPDVRTADLHALWQELDAQGLASPNIGTIGDIIACPGLDYCSLANAVSIPVAQRISNRFADLRRQRDIGDLRIKISGCINACGHHHVGDIGILGVDKKGEPHYQVTLGGRIGEEPALGTIIGPAFPAEGIVDAVETIVTTYLAVRRDGEAFSETWRRIGTTPFKEALYGAD